MASIAASNIPQETPSKAAAKALADFDLNSKAASTTSEGAAEKGSGSDAPSLLSKMQATMSTKDQSRTYHELTLNNGEKLKHASVAPRTKFVGDLSITDDSQEPLLKETASRFVLFPIQYHEVRACMHASIRLMSVCVLMLPSFTHSPQIWQMYKKAEVRCSRARARSTGSYPTLTTR